MKTYIITTQSACNDYLLHSIGVERYETADYDEARKVFEREVEVLAEQYKLENQIEGEVTDYDQSHAIYCSLKAYDEDPDDIEYIEDSDYYYEY